MSRMFKNTKESTSKYRKFKISPLIAVVAVVEVLVLIGVSTFAWFTFAANKQLDSGYISVEADSGLDIDFQYANKEDYINIWNYIDKNFEFEPVTSLDGRNVYVPTSGTFGNQETGNMVFRDGTVNDINSKYINIDFELTNTSSVPVDVYLNNNSYFKVRKAGQLEESRALRLAFYPNNGKSGNVGSSLIRNSSNTASDGADDSSQASADSYTVYFDNSSANWDNVYAYFYDTNGNASPVYKDAWPGVQMTRVSGRTYSVTISNPVISGTTVKYNKLIFTNGNGTQSATTYSIDSTKKNYVYKTDSSGTNTSSYPKAYTTKTVYFVKPNWWDKVYCALFNNTTNTYYTDGKGDEMKYVGSGIYSYSFDASVTDTSGYNILFDNGNWSTSSNRYSQTVDFSPVANRLYYVNGTSGYKYTVTQLQRSGNDVHYQAEGDNDTYAMKYNTVYFFNSFSWTNPYAKVSRSTQDDIYTLDLPMVSLSGNVYYCTVPEFFDKVYFRDKESGNNTSLRSERVTIADGTVYRPTDDATPRPLESFIYSSYIQESGYPVISPGVSVGFQRAYSPVITIDADSGAATEVLPAFSNSIDTYIYGSGNPVFTIEAGHLLSLSMVLWLEGTDEATFDDTYPANDIELKLEFATVTKNDQLSPPQPNVAFNTGESGFYTYNFYDKTRELWTSDRQPTESGVTVAPVMQLYDNTIKRGYLMSPKEYSSYDGKSKVSCWTVKAPPSIATLGHDIIFRRVNPYDEDEVWNYWHAGRVAGGSSSAVYESIDDTAVRYTPYTIATGGTSGENTVISFTAFADGSPLNTLTGMQNDTDTTYKAPDQSCGGLWGNHSVRTVTVYDGLRNQPLKENGGVLTVNYEYSYSSSSGSRTARIEYKASGPSFNSFYYFIMPEVAYATRIDCAFKRYTGFDPGYAINSAQKNGNITFVGYYGKNSKVSGDYFELNQKTDNTDYSYWGSDLLYIQTTDVTRNEFYTSSSENDTNAKLLQAHFVSQSGNNDSYSYLYYNGNFNRNSSNSNAGHGYVAVVPNDYVYTGYKIESCSFHGNDKYNISAVQTVSQASSVRITDPLNSSTYYDMIINHLNGQNGINLNYLYVWLYLQTNKKGYQNDPKVYAWNSSNTNQKNATYPGVTMTSVANYNNNTVTKYKYKLDMSHYNRFHFVFYSNNNSQELWTDGYDSGRLFYAIDTYIASRNNDSYEAGVTKNEMIDTNNWSTDWPHLTLQS